MSDLEAQLLVERQKAEKFRSKLLLLARQWVKEGNDLRASVDLSDPSQPRPSTFYACAQELRDLVERES